MIKETQNSLFSLTNDNDTCFLRGKTILPKKISGKSSLFKLNLELDLNIKTFKLPALKNRSPWVSHIKNFEFPKGPFGFLYN